MEPLRSPVLARGAPLRRQERNAVDLVTEALRNTPRAQLWASLELFEPSRGAMEIDLLVLGHYGLYVVEIKTWTGKISGDERSWKLAPAEGLTRDIGSPLRMVEQKARLLKRFFQQELGSGAGRLRVEPMVLLSGAGVEIALKPPARRGVVTQAELLRAIQFGELPGAEGGFEPTPIDEPTAEGVRRILDNLRRRPRPGRGSLLDELPLLLRDLALDLKQEAHAPEVRNALKLRHASERASGLTGATLQDWTQRWIEELAAAWVISCAFVRVLEEKKWVEHNGLAGAGAEAAEERFLQGESSRTAKDYLLAVLRGASVYPACETILGEQYNPIWTLPPSEQGARLMLAFFRWEDDRGKLRWDFAADYGGRWVDFYGNLSAFLQAEHGMVATPSFVGELLLDLTLEPAIAERGLDSIRMIDPACGSGMLLTGAFHRLDEHRRRVSPGADPVTSARDALDRVYGVDISVAAALVTRLNLLFAYLDRTKAEHIGAVASLPLHIAVADSLATGKEPHPAELPVLWQGLEVDGPEARNMLQLRYPVVVTEAPSVPCRDSKRRQFYRKHYASASQRYALSTPFIERCFQLAAADGHVGVFSANSFMKRQFGKALVEEVLSLVDVTRIIDTSGAFIPGHATPTVVLVARNRAPQLSRVRAVMSKRGEPFLPIHPEEAKVWSSITAHLDDGVYEDEYIAVADIPREPLARHPWVLATGTHAEIITAMEQSRLLLATRVAGIDQGSLSGLDDVFVLPANVPQRLGLEPDVIRPLISATFLSDWAAGSQQAALVPYQRETAIALSPDRAQRWSQFLWRFRTILRERRAMGADLQGPWWTWTVWRVRSRFGAPRIVCPRIGTGNDFALEHGGATIHWSIQVIEPREEDTEDDHFALLGFLNSSAAGFWMKQTSFRNVVGGDSRLIHEYYDFTGSLAKMPIAAVISEPGPIRDEIVALARRLDGAARELDSCTPLHVLHMWDRTSRASLLQALADAQMRELGIFRRMISDQEDLDWAVYEALGLCNGMRRSPASRAGSALPEQRPFMWLSDAPPVGLDAGIIEVWKRRREVIRQNGAIQTLENASYKRPFRRPAVSVEPTGSPEPSEVDADIPTGGTLRAGRDETGAGDFRRRTVAACEQWLLDRLEDEFRAMQAPRCASIQALASRLGSVGGATAVISVYRDSEGADAADIIGPLLAMHAVPYLAALRHTASGLAKRAEWEATWEQQRREDLGERVHPPVPPRYDPKDFRDAVTWRHRGKLDVPHEPFVAYRNAERDSKDVLYGWAGWSAAEQAEALFALYKERREEDGWKPSRLVPLLGGILELVSWISPWHGPGIDAEEERPADLYKRIVEAEAQRLGVSIKTIRAWRPPGRREKA